MSSLDVTSEMTTNFCYCNLMAYVPYRFGSHWCDHASRLIYWPSVGLTSFSSIVLLMNIANYARVLHITHMLFNDHDHLWL